MHGESYFERTCHTEREIRELLSQPSVDCLLMRARMRYVRRLVIHVTLVLCALLRARHRGKFMPWTALVVQDLEWIRRNSHKAWIRSLHCTLTHPGVRITSIRGEESSDVVSRFFSSLLPVPIRVETGYRSVIVQCCCFLCAVLVGLFALRVVNGRLTKNKRKPIDC